MRSQLSFGLATLLVSAAAVGSSVAGCTAAPASEAQGARSSAFGDGTGSLTDFTGLCLGPANGSTDAGAPIVLATCDGSAAQTWTVTGEVFTNSASGKCLDVQGASTDNGARVQLWDCNGTEAQSWTATGGQLIGAGGKCLDVAAFNSVPGQTLETWDCNGGQNQQFDVTLTAAPADGGASAPLPPPTTPAAGPADGVAAASALDFLSSISVCTHVGQGVDDPTRSATAMTFAGIRNLRDDGRAEHAQDWITMHDQAGIKVDMLAGSDLASTLDLARKLQAAGALLAVEGPNEPNNFPVTYGGQTSSYDTTFTPVASLQRDLYASVKADAALASIPVFHSSEAGGSEPDNVGLQFLTIPAGAGTTMPDGTRYADYANTHNYVCGHSGKLVDNVSWSASDPTLNGDWDGMVVEYGKTWHKGFAGYSNDELVKLPKVTTETGWTTTGDGSITQEQQAKVLLNLYLSAFKQGWSYTFVYMLRDDPGQGYWGLFDTDYNPKVSGTYLHNLTTILADTTSATPGNLAYSIANQPPTVHDLLIRKSSGKFELVVWNERMTGGSDAVTVTLGAAASVTLYDPTTGTAPTATLDGVTSVPLTLTDHPVILEL